MPSTPVIFDFVPETNHSPQAAPTDFQVIEKSEVASGNDTTIFPSSGSYLTKPSQIYVEETRSEETQSIQPENVLPTQDSQEEDEPVIDLQSVEKETMNAKEEPSVQTKQHIMKATV